MTGISTPAPIAKPNPVSVFDSTSPFHDNEAGFEDEPMT